MSSIPVHASSSAPPKPQEKQIQLLFKGSDRRSVPAETSFGWCTDKFLGHVTDDADEIVIGKRPVEDDGNATSAKLFKKKGGSTQSTINSIFKKNLREEACIEIASFFYNNAIAFNVAKSEEFQKMLELVSRHGLGFKAPSYHEIRTKYLKYKMEEKKKYSVDSGEMPAMGLIYEVMDQAKEKIQAQWCSKKLQASMGYN
ncbi:unnamed protein product [Vicia faba]|uniref:Uncharacterized protein n=1 Tax=Vicia faba TaxID=3906 RepID=A0AAV0ZLM2_VICFA|nr:unnamed protein product [Vicia faba]